MSETATQARVEPAPCVLTPRERLEALCDVGSVRVIGEGPRGRGARLGRSGAAREGVITGAGCVDGRPVYCYAQDRTVGGGALGEAQARQILRVMRLAGEWGAPIVGFIDSGGARIQEGPRALGAYGRIFRMNVALSQRVPQISVIGGAAAGGACYSPALTDFVVMTAQANMFLTGPGVVREVTGEAVTAQELGGPRVQTRNGVCDLVGRDDLHAAELARELLSFLPQNAADGPIQSRPRDAGGLDPAGCVPLIPSQVYDVREVVRRLVDAGAFFELAPRWARNMVTGFARLDGRPVGVIANQPRYLGGVIDVGASQKGARFIDTCDAFGLPLVVLVDTPGFMPGAKHEASGIIRHGAGLLHAFSKARVGKITVVLRKAFGGGLITMNSKDLGADFAFVWPQAEMGVLGARAAVGIIHRREIAAAADPAQEAHRRAVAYAEEHEGPTAAVRVGIADEIVFPSRTRSRLIEALASIEAGSSGRSGAQVLPSI